MKKHKTKAEKAEARFQRDLKRFQANAASLTQEEIDAIQKALQKAIDSASQ